MEQAKVIKYNNQDTFECIVDLVNAISKAVPSVVFKPHANYINTYNADKTLYPQGVVYGFSVFHESDLNNPIGKVSVENYHTKTPKYCIQNINIHDGRATWGEDGQYKSSIHAKNIVRVAKKVFKPFTFQQIAMRHFREFNGSIEQIRYNMTWEARQNTCHDFDKFAQDLYHLHSIGYEPINPEIKKMIEYTINNKERLDKYLNYNPNYYFVLVKDDKVEYCLRSENHNAVIFPNPTTVASKDDLPEDIKGKLFVLDITDKKDFVEDIGLKENNGAYWILA